MKSCSVCNLSIINIISSVTLSLGYLPHMLSVMMLLNESHHLSPRRATHHSMGYYPYFNKGLIHSFSLASAFS